MSSSMGVVARCGSLRKIRIRHCCMLQRENPSLYLERSTGDPISSKFNSITCQDFLKRLLRHRPWNRRIVVILDHARYHQVTLLKPFLSEKRDVLSLAFLPPYSPELNPVERVWNLTRKLGAHNQCFPQLSDLISTVTRPLELGNRPKNRLPQLCGIT